MLKTLLCASAAAAALAWAPVALAETALVTGVDQIVVTANRSARPIDTVGGQITVLDADRIRETQTVLVSDLLEQTPGVAVSRNGGVGGATQLRIRGAEADQTVVLIDGVKLNDPSSTGGGYNFANLLAGDVARIEVLRGAQSVLWGSQAIGGVVNVITADPTQPFEGNVSAEVGSRHTAYARAGLGGVSERVTWRVTASQYVTDGFSSFARSRGGRENDGYRNTGAGGKARVRLTDQLSLDLRAVYSKGRNAFDGFPAPSFAFADTSEYGETTDFVGYVGANLDLFGGRFHNRLAYAYTDTDRDNFNPAQAVTTKTFDAAGQNRRWEYQGDVTITETWRAVFGAESERSQFRTASPSAFTPNPVAAGQKVTLTGVYAQLQAEIAKGLTVTGGVRKDDHDTFGESTVGQASVAYAVNDGATVLRASWGQGFKAPTLYQLYSEYGNTRLDPEESDSWDAGVEQTVLDGAVTVQAAYFDRSTKNQIDFVSCTAATALAGCVAPSGARRFGFYSNTARTEAHGIELQAKATLGKRLTAQGSYTWTDTENTSPGAANRGKQLQRRPETIGYAEVSYVWPAALTTSLAVQYVGDSYDDAANRTLDKAYTLVDVRASYPVTDALEVYGRVENLGDERYESIRNYGQPGRTAALGVRAKF